MFADGFFQIRGHPRHPCLKLMIRTATLIQDFHPRAYNHAWHTNKSPEDYPGLSNFFTVV